MTANEAIARAARADPPRDVAIAAGRVFMSNLDLPLRVLLHAPIKHYDRSTFYTSESAGYTDRPCLEQDEIASLVQTASRHPQGKRPLQAHFEEYLRLLRI